MAPRSKGGYALAALLLAVLGLAAPARAQVGGGAPIAYLYCYNGTVPTSPLSWAPCSASNPLVVGGGAVTIANGADVAEGSTTDAPATVPTSATAATSIALLKALNNGVASSIPIGTNIIGKVGIDQTTPGTTNLVALTATTNAGASVVKGGVGVVNGGSTYQAVAASQTATVLQSSTGVIGDYLSHCVIYPTSTSPGVVTVFDNTNAAAGSVILFPGGAASVTNLVPFAIPVGAISTAGAWKVTTGANVSAVCFGKFS